MKTSKKGSKQAEKSLEKQRYSRHRFLTISRIFRYGLNSFFRNSWLSIAATAVMTITLLIIFSAAAIQNVLSDTLGDLREKVDMSIYLKTDTTDEAGAQLTSELNKLPSVVSVTYISAEEARAQIAEENGDDADMLAALKEATNMTPATLRVVINDIDDTSELENFVENNELVKEYISDDYEPSFAGERRGTIKSIGRAVSFAQKVGIGAASIFVVVSALIIFNTIRMAIFNRKEEIQMMKLIGASRSFIRGPFLVESVIYGILAALIATGVGIFCLNQVAETLNTYQISVQSTLDILNNQAVIVTLSMIGIGTVVGIISSLLATRRYLKI